MLPAALADSNAVQTLLNQHWEDALPEPIVISKSHAGHQGCPDGESLGTLSKQHPVPCSALINIPNSGILFCFAVSLLNQSAMKHASPRLALGHAQWSASRPETGDEAHGATLAGGNGLPAMPRVFNVLTEEHGASG